MWYVMVYDDSGHRYVIPEDKLEDWENWLNLEESNEDSWIEPHYAKRIEGRLRFKEWESDN